MPFNNKPTVMVVDDDQDILTLLRLMLSKEGYTVRTATSAEEALRQIPIEMPDVAILDVMLPKMDGYALCRQLRASPSTHLMPILMLTAKGELEDKIAGFQAGADDYVVKPVQEEELRYRVRGLFARLAAAHDYKFQPLPRGRVFVVFGTKGGSGKTTIAVNFALALRRQSNLRVALFDADFSFGEVGIHLNLPPVHSIVDLAKNVNEIEPEMVTQVMLSHGSGVRALLAPFRPEQADLITPDHVRRILDLVATSHDYIVVDCPSNYDERNLVLLEQADAVLLVVPPEVGPLKNASLFLEMSNQLGVAKEKVYVILNRANSNVGITPAEIERIFRRPLSLQMPSGGRAITAGGNQGRPLVTDQPNHPFSQQCLKMADFFIKQQKPA